MENESQHGVGTQKRTVYYIESALPEKEYNAVYVNAKSIFYFTDAWLGEVKSKSKKAELEKQKNKGAEGRSGKIQRRKGETQYVTNVMDSQEK